MPTTAPPTRPATSTPLVRVAYRPARDTLITSGGFLTVSVAGAVSSLLLLLVVGAGPDTDAVVAGYSLFLVVSLFAATVRPVLVPAYGAVDPETAQVEVLDYLSTEDVGRAVNPLIVHGQAIGAAVQGLGGAFLDEFKYDAHGQLLTGSFADYLLPTATDFPHVAALTLEESPSLLNPLGAKGAGEGGIVAVGAAVGNAVAHALAPLGVVITAMPLSLDNLARAIRAARDEGGA